MEIFAHTSLVGHWLVYDQTIDQWWAVPAHVHGWNHRVRAAKPTQESITRVVRQLAAADCVGIPH